MLFSFSGIPSAPFKDTLQRKRERSPLVVSENIIFACFPDEEEAHDK